MLQRCQFNGERMVVTEVVSLMEGEWSCYRGGASWREHDHVTEESVMWSANGHVASLNEGEWLCYKDGQFNGGRIVPMEVASLKKGEWLI